MRRTIAAAFLNEGITELELKTLLAVAAFTGSWSRVDDEIYVAQLARFTYGVSERAELQRWQVKKIGEALGSLRRKGVIVYEDRLGAGTRQLGMLDGIEPLDGEAREVWTAAEDFCRAVFGEVPSPEGTSEENKSPRKSQKGPSQEPISPLPGGDSPVLPVIPANQRRRIENHARGRARLEDFDETDLRTELIGLMKREDITANGGMDPVEYGVECFRSALEQARDQ